MTLLIILYWTILVLATFAYLAFHVTYTMPVALLALFIIIGLKAFRTPIQ